MYNTQLKPNYLPYEDDKGYTVLRFWEHDIYHDLEVCLTKIKSVLP